MPAEAYPLSRSDLSSVSEEIRGQAEAYAAARSAGGIDNETFDVTAARAALSGTRRAHAIDLPCRRGEICGVPVVHIGDDPGRGPLLVHIHGGGFVGGTLESHGPIAAALARATGWPALFIEYRLAPEHPFPAAFDDCEKVISNLDGGRAVAIAGDSVGGALSLWSAHVASQRGGQSVFALALMAPMLDFDAATSEYMRTSGRARSMIGNAIRSADLSDPRLRLPWEESAMFPPTIVQTGGSDYVADDGLRFATQSGRGGRPVVWEHWPNMPHVWQRYAPDAPEAASALMHVAQFFKNQLS